MIMISKARGSATSFALGLLIMAALWAWHDAHMRRSPDIETISLTPNTRHFYFRHYGENYVAVVPVLQGLNGYSVPVFVWKRDLHSGPSEPDVQYASYDYMPDCVYIDRCTNNPPGVECPHQLKPRK
jgi:ABC-type proline/glycine betaine transport system substrate-binding protein